MASVKFTQEHEWIRVEGTTGVVGITNYAQEQLGDVVYVELPDIGRKVMKGQQAAVVESVKAASEIYAPVSGEVTEVNGALADSPGGVNQDAQGNGWFFKIKISSPTELEGLMDEAGYAAFVEGLK
ncbi:MAG: glycine cleavage system protein GcvH [Alphaproteobacteria bacterium]|nr:glycine cleavage system protein GcvH [Alphaproteobacteria bacterium]